MSLGHLGHTRSRRALDHLLQTPDTFVSAPLPGMVDATAVVHASPALGAGFTQYTATLEPGGQLGETVHSRFVYVLRGSVDVTRDAERNTVEAGGFAYLPPGLAYTVNGVCRRGAGCGD